MPKFAINWGPELLGYGVEFNFAEELGTADDRDKAVRQLNRNLKFRQALSYATDRDGIAQAIMRGPFLRGYAGGLYPGAPDFDKKSVVYYPYDVESAKTLLAEIGLKDTNGDGVLRVDGRPAEGSAGRVADAGIRRRAGDPERGRSPGQPVGRGRHQGQHARDQQRHTGRKSTPQLHGMCASIAAGRCLRCRLPIQRRWRPITANFGMPPRRRQAAQADGLRAVDRSTSWRNIARRSMRPSARS